MPRSNTPIIHFYRATVSQAATWRKRLDATTNWAVVTSVGVISFVFNSPTSPHFLILMLLVANVFFLLMEARRYQLHDIWQTRLDTLDRYFFAPALIDSSPPEEESRANDALRELGEDLGETTPKTRMIDALGLRLRRNYLYIFGVVLGAWGLKLYIHPERPPTSLDAFAARAAVGLVGGPVILAAVAVAILVMTALALRAPSEYRVDWSTQPSPWKRFTSFRWFAPPPSGADQIRATFYGAFESPPDVDAASSSSGSTRDG